MNLLRLLCVTGGVLVLSGCTGVQPAAPPPASAAVQPQGTTAPPATVSLLRGVNVTEVPALAAGAEARELPATLVIPPGTYQFQGKSYDLTKEGLYRLLLPPKATQQRIVYKSDALALVSALCWLHSHGYREDGKSHDELMRQALTGKLIMTCGPLSNFCLKLFSDLGVRTRVVTPRALTRNGYDDGHVLVEIVLDKRWVLMDLDQHATFWRHGKRLTLLDVAGH